eukprot:356395-Chlamydomonas_euryale.AAC.2
MDGRRDCRVFGLVRWNARMDEARDRTASSCWLRAAALCKTAVAIRGLASHNSAIATRAGTPSNARRPCGACPPMLAAPAGRAHQRTARAAVPTNTTRRPAPMPCAVWRGADTRADARAEAATGGAEARGAGRHAGAQEHPPRRHARQRRCGDGQGGGLHVRQDQPQV